MLRYAIVDTCRAPEALDVDFVQLRDKTVSGSQLFAVALRWKQALNGTPTKLLVNHRADIALAAGADGVHLTAGRDELCVPQLHEIFNRARRPRPLVSVSCHTLDEVLRAHEADVILFGPVFEKRVGADIVAHGIGLGPLEQAAAASHVPLLALGGITAERIPACMNAGAAGIAAIRLFT